MKNILVIGSGGQIGSELVPALRARYGEVNVVATDIRDDVNPVLKEGPFAVLDALDVQAVAKIIKEHKIDAIYNMVAVLSATGEKFPKKAWDINMGSLLNCLEVAREFGCAVSTPSSIGAFGPTTPADDTPQNTIMRPTTIYGVSKVAAELLSDYYFSRFGVDTRGLRYPGIISNVTPPGGGTTDYAVDIFYEAVKHKKYSCFLAEGTRLDMMYMPDAVKAAIDLMEADPAKLIHRNCFNVTAMSFAPEDLYKEIKKHIPEFEMTYNVDPDRQKIADSWPNSMDDSIARTEWNWQADFGFKAMVSDMLKVLSKRLK